MLRNLPPIAAPESVLAEARANCAARSRARGHHAVADAYERGDTAGWAFRHEVARLVAERGAKAEHRPS